jgi:hypothetical protein
METAVCDVRLGRLVLRLRVAALLVVGFGFLGGLAIGRVGVRQTWDAWQSTNWKTVAGVITSAETSFATQTTSRDDPVQRGRGIRQEVEKDVFFARLTYSFEVNGQQHTGHRIGVADVGSDNHSAAADITARYATGTAVTVHVHPTDPSQSVLESGITFGAVGPLIIGVVLCFCFGSLAFGVLSKTFVSLVDSFTKPAGSYLVNKDGRLVPLKRKGKPPRGPDNSDSFGSP